MPPKGLGTPPPIEFFQRPVLEVAQGLLGLVLESRTAAGTTAGRIVEVEAYRGPADLAAHSARGRRTPRNEVLYGPGGRAYVYLIYGLHHCANVVVGGAGIPEAVLIRALEPVAGRDAMRERRGGRVPDLRLACGPGNLTRALAIDLTHNGTSLRRGRLRLLVPPPERFTPIPPRDVVRSPRIGIDYSGSWAHKPWRFSLREHPCVSRPPRLSDRARSVRSARPERRPGRSSPR